MTIELHIWGPAFGLPSIDATCLGVIAYLRECLPSDQWRLVPSTPAGNPLGELPALKDGTRWVTGFGNIIDYLRQSCDDASDIDEHLNPSDTAERTAYTSFILSRGQPLLDLSLYVSSENYSACTKPALGVLLPWPDSWFVPHRLRDKARKRSEHLGLSGLDVDSAQDDRKKEGLAAQIPESLKTPKRTVSALLGQDLRKSKFRLDALTSDFFAPLDDLLGEGPWLLSDQPTSVDCLAVGYLLIMQASAEGSQAWLRDALGTKFPGLSKWAQARRQEWFGQAIQATSVLEGQMASHVLPWQRPASQSPAQVANALARNAAETVPFLKSYLAPTTVTAEMRPGASKYHEKKQEAIARLQSQSLLQSQIIASTLAFSLIAGVLVYNGLLRLPRLRSTAPVSREFGTAGDFLGLR